MSEYLERALTFLEKTHTTLTIEPGQGDKRPLWHKEGDQMMAHYVVTLANKRSKYTFDFWDSINAKEAIDALDYLKGAGYGDYSPKRYESEKKLQNKLGLVVTVGSAKNKYAEFREALKPNAYSILAALDQLYADSFEDFCAEYGYDTDSKTAEKTYNAVIEQDRQLRRLFSPEELDRLSEIQ